MRLPWRHGDPTDAPNERPPRVVVGAGPGRDGAVSRMLWRIAHGDWRGGGAAGDAAGVGPVA